VRINLPLSAFPLVQKKSVRDFETFIGSRSRDQSESHAGIVVSLVLLPLLQYSNVRLKPPKSPFSVDHAMFNQGAPLVVLICTPPFLGLLRLFEIPLIPPFPLIPIKVGDRFP